MHPRFALLLTLTLSGFLVAQTSSSKSKPHGKSTPAPHETAETLYRNPDFAFTYKIPYAWIDRTKQMQDDSADPAK